MIFDASRLPLPARGAADLCVVGSGPGGATAAMVCAEAGLHVVVLEAGGLVLPSGSTQREEEMIPQLLWHAGGRTTTNRAVQVHQGRAVGGSAIHNTCLCKRIPEGVLRGWLQSHGLEHLPLPVWASLYEEAERLLSVHTIPVERWSRHNQLLGEGADELGWRWGGLSHNRTNCLSSGFCELGCAYDAKNNALKVCIPRLLKAAGEVLTRCQAVRVRHEEGQVAGVEAVAVHPVTGEALGEVIIDAPRVCLSASATGTAAILLRSDVPDPSGATGRGLHIHPGIFAAGDFEEPVRAWDGIPQSTECTHFLDVWGGHPEHRTWIITAFSHPMAFAALLPSHGPVHRQAIERYAHTGVFTAMLHDHTSGVVEPKGDLDVSIDYWPNQADQAELAFGLSRCVELLFAAGARKVMVPGAEIRSIDRPEQIEALDLSVTPDTSTLVAVHPMSTVPMGDDPAQCPVDSRGAHHQVRGLWVSDGSLFPTSIGGPPQLSIYALGLHIGRAIASTAS